MANFPLSIAIPDGLLNRYQVDESLLGYIIVKKFADHLPLYGQSDILAREELGISRQTWNVILDILGDLGYNEAIQKPYT